MREIRATTILNKQKRRDDWFLTDYSVNPYSGCTIDCSYCYVYGSKYGAHVADQFSVKSNAVELFDRQLRRRAEKGEFGFIALASATDPYLHVEERLGLTRRILEIILRYRFPVTICTKSTLVRRDVDLLRAIDASATLPPNLKASPGRGAIVMVSISTLDEHVAGLLEPGAASPLERLETVSHCVSNGLMAGVGFIPVLPLISDSDVQLEEMIRKAKEFSAQFVFVGGLTLFGDQTSDSKTRYFRFLTVHFPHLVREYQSMYGESFAPPRHHQNRLEARARTLCNRYGLRYGIH